MALFYISVRNIRILGLVRVKYSLIDLKLFVAVAEQRNLTKGADIACLAPSSASHRIKKLEKALGVALLEREARGVSLTVAGEILLRHARRVFATLEQMHSDISPYSNGAQAHVRLWANTNAIHTYLPDDIGAFLELYPAVSISLEEHTSAKIASAVAEGDIELGIVAQQDQSADVRLHPYRKDRLVMVVPDSHPVARQQSVRFAQVLEYPFVLLEEGSAIHTFTLNKSAVAGGHLNIRAQVKSFDAVCRMVSTGVGIGLIPNDSVVKSPELKLKTVELEEDWAERDLMICTQPEAVLSEAAAVLLHFLRQRAVKSV